MIYRLELKDQKEIPLRSIKVKTPTDRMLFHRNDWTKNNSTRY